MLTQWGDFNLFSFLFRIKIDCLRFQNIIQNPLRSDLLSARIQLLYALLSSQPNPTWPCSVTSASNNQYQSLNLAHSTLLQHAVKLTCISAQSIYSFIWMFHKDLRKTIMVDFTLLLHYNSKGNIVVFRLLLYMHLTAIVTSYTFYIQKLWWT